MDFFRFSEKMPFALTIGVILWGVSGVITLSLFVELAGTDWWKLVFAMLWAVGLEVTKLISWRRGGIYRLLALGLMLITLFSALGMALAVVERSQEQSFRTSLVASDEYKAQKKVVSELESQVDALLNRLRLLPPEYISAALELNKTLDSLNRELKESRLKLEGLQQGKGAMSSEPGIFGRIAKALNLNVKGLEVGIIMFLALMTELSALMMTNRSDIGAKSKPILAVTPEIYLEVALNHPKAPHLLGRTKVSRILNITENQARGLLSELVKQGRVRVEGKTFVLSEEFSLKDSELIKALKLPPKQKTSS